MHLTLTKKFILSYILFGISCFLLIFTVTSALIMDQILEEKADTFYQEGIYMSDQYVGHYFDQQDSLTKRSAVRSHLNALSIYLNARICLINTEGEIILDSSQTGSADPRALIDHFDPVLPGDRYYTTGDFFGTLEEESLSVLVPVTHNYHVRGYIAIHTPMSTDSRERKLSFSLLRHIDRALHSRLPLCFRKLDDPLSPAP